jgi:hypothetical protein
MCTVYFSGVNVQTIRILRAIRNNRTPRPAGDIDGVKRKGLIAAMVCHTVFDVVIKVIFPLVTGD